MVLQEERGNEDQDLCTQGERESATEKGEKLEVSRQKKKGGKKAERSQEQQGKGRVKAGVKVLFTSDQSS